LLESSNKRNQHFLLFLFQRTSKCSSFSSLSALFDCWHFKCCHFKKVHQGSIWTWICKNHFGLDRFTNKWSNISSIKFYQKWQINLYNKTTHHIH
jgi:hypothetical protein